MYRTLIVKGEAGAEKKECYDCKHCQAAISWWCYNKEAINWRGTRIPGTSNCKYWEPTTHVRDITPKERKNMYYIEIDCTEETRSQLEQINRRR